MPWEDRQTGIPPCGKRGRDWSDESSSQGTRTVGCHEKLAERYGTDSPFRALTMNEPC